ncbi:LacI family DNA-binding transcriptional regulator [Deminuibacter soli]|uniref:LacI family transcriptional regulator n=1 Tax=Deminuibacter soli TaxID=2291815 RepID=A0A3E1NNF6_9BACT|nr:substrate-binding domain-containing protein [Deminuibacter soli]RFM29466.1 LacI family transcriptional regulator [Deminuibacter soli]
MKRVSLKDIAAMVGASPSTVSFVLNGKAKEMRISQVVADKITAAAKKAGYYPNQIAVSLRTGQTKILGLIVESIAGNFFASLARIIEDKAEAHGYKVVYCSTENNGNRGNEMIRMLSQRQLDGYLITPAAGMEKDIQQLIAQRKPVILIDSYFPGLQIPHVLVNSYAGVTEGMEHLIKQGYRNIAWVTVDLDLIQVHDRTRAYTDSLKKHKLKPNEQWILKLPYDYSKEKSVQAICDFLANNKGIDAVFFATNYLGVTGLESITKLKLSIPQNLAMICFDDHDIFRLYPGGITIIQQPIEEIAQASIDLLMSKLGKQQVMHEVTGKDLVELPPALIVRGSTLQK